MRNNETVHANIFTYPYGAIQSPPPNKDVPKCTYSLIQYWTFFPQIEGCVLRLFDFHICCFYLKGHRTIF